MSHGPLCRSPLHEMFLRVKSVLILYSLFTKHFMCLISLKVLKKLYEAGIDQHLRPSPVTQLGSQSRPCRLPVCEDVKKWYRYLSALSQPLVKASIWLTPLQWFLQKPEGQGPSWEWVISTENSLVYLEREGGSILPRAHTCIQVVFLFLLLTSLSGQEWKMESVCQTIWVRTVVARDSAGKRKGFGAWPACRTPDRDPLTRSQVFLNCTRPPPPAQTTKWALFRRVGSEAGEHPVSLSKC